METMGNVWDEINPPRFTALDRDISCDVCVVGAGIAGLTTAYLLLKEGRSVAVLDRNKLGQGETARTSAHLSNALDDRYYILEKFHGENGIRLAAESHGAAIDRIERICEEEKIECEFERVNGYLFLGPDSEEDELDKELEAAHKAGLISVAKLERAPTRSFNTGPCLSFPNQAQFHPTKYIYGLAGTIKRLGGKIFTNTNVKEFVGGDVAHVAAENGHKARAGSIVLATNVPVNDRVVVHTKQAAYRSYVIGVKIPAGAVSRALYWDTDDPYHYIRLEKIPDDSKHELLIVGGEDHKVGQMENGEEKSYGGLESWARKHFPEMTTVKYKWSGQIIEPADGLAYIGRNPMDKPNVYIVTGDSGNGLTHGTIAGILITDLIEGRENPWASLYNPSRPPRSIKDFLKENLNVVPQYSDWVTPGEIKSADRIKRGSGKIVRKGLRKIAAYRDEKGKLHECSAVCPHLGCIVKWNSNENTWDCPCHGSRFRATGEVLNGPANSDLESLLAEKSK